MSKKKLTILVLVTCLLGLLMAAGWKYASVDATESYGINPEHSPEARLKYIMVRLFAPAAPRGIHARVRRERLRLLNQLRDELGRGAPRVVRVNTLKQALVANDQSWDRSPLFVEKRARASYYKNVKAPKLAPAMMSKTDFTVPPFLIYGGGSRRLMRWVAAPTVRIRVMLTGPSGRRRAVRPTHSIGAYHEAELRNLRPGSYRWSAGQHAGAFAVGTPRSLLFYADTQDSLPLHRLTMRFLRKLHAAEPVDLLIHGGDLTSWGSNEANLIECARIVGGLGVAGLYAIGNHEFKEDYGYTADAPYYRRLFSPTPMNRARSYAAYPLAGGAVSLALWDSNLVRMGARDFMAQHRFLMQILHSRRPSILVSHHGVMTRGWHGSFMGSHIEEWMRALYLPAFRKSRLLLTLTGHEHIYQRFTDPRSPYGTQHVVTGPASAAILFPFFKGDGQIQALQRKRTVIRVDLGNGEMRMRTYDIATGRVIDRFTRKL